MALQEDSSATEILASLPTKRWHVTARRWHHDGLHKVNAVSLFERDFGATWEVDVTTPALEFDLAASAKHLSDRKDGHPDPAMLASDGRQWVPGLGLHVHGCFTLMFEFGSTGRDIRDIGFGSLAGFHLVSWQFLF